MKFEIENAEKDNLKVVNQVLRLIFWYDTKTLNGVKNILTTLFDESKGIYKNYIWGRGGSHIWLSQKEDGKRIMIFT